VRSKLRLAAVAMFIAGGVAAMGIACGGGGFESQSKVNTVRVFGVKPDKPYAKPGETVTLEVLSADARPVKPRPLKIFWIPVVCMNPRDDLYYLCFAAAAPQQPGVPAVAQLRAPFPPDGGVDGGAGGDAGAALAAADAGAGAGSPLDRIPKGIDLSPFLPQGPTFSFRMPDDAVQPRVGGPPYGLAIVFNIACAGQVRLAERSAGGGPQQVPIECTDEGGTPLSADDYVISINRVYSYPDRTNTNPVVEKITLDGVDVDPQKGITVDRCVADRRRNCKAVKIDVRVSDSSWEPNPSPGATDQREQIWVTYYSNVGDLADEARLLFDSKAGRISESGVEYRAPYEPVEGTLWAVVHDNRAGAEFLVVPIHVK
jgi:hypothetical protein